MLLLTGTPPFRDAVVIHISPFDKLRANG